MTSTIRKGRIGELKVISDLLEKGYDIYTPVIDDNGIDFIISNGNRIKSVQVKNHNKTKYASSVEINTRKCKGVDVIAIPIKAVGCVCYVPSKMVNRSINIAFTEASSGQILYRHWYKDYMEFPWKD